MKLASFIHDRVETYGTVSAGGVHPVSDSFRRRHADLRAAIAGDAIGGLEQCCAEQPVAFDKVIFLPPIPNPDKIICAGLNYRKPYPVDGVAPPDPDNIVLFARYRDTLIGHLGELEQPVGAAADTFDFEGEIAVVIGRGGRHIKADDALSHVLGYSAMNEGSVRGWMKHSVHAGKNFHASGSWGPWITTATRQESRKRWSWRCG
jgi:2-keto-4-pentenoate hydratase/2-oxohepta-3-ene-1,7-dioic acid hydratase in catechol pathway